MSRPKSYTVAGQHFATQAALESAVRVALAGHPMNAPFYDAFLAAVINELNDQVRAAGQVATGRFEHLDVFEQERRGLEGDLYYRNVLLALFEPSGRWLPVSVYPWRRRQRSHHRDIEEALRRILADYLPEPWDRERCAVPNCPVRGGVVFTHTAPTWKEIADGCLSLVTPDELESRFGYNRYDPERCELYRLIPAAHPAIRHLIVSHSAAKWKWLCAEHHRAAVMGCVAEQGPMKLLARRRVAR